MAVHKAKVTREGWFGKITIDDSRTETFSSHVDVIKWDELCNKVNGALSPLQILRLFSMIWTIIFIIVLIPYIILTTRASDALSPHFDPLIHSHGFVGDVNRIFFPIAGVIALLIGGKMDQAAQKALSDIDDICEEYSTMLKSKNVSFTFENKAENEDRKGELMKPNPDLYVKIETLSDTAEQDLENPIDTVQAVAVEVETVKPSAPVAEPTVTETHNPTLAEKLADLEAAKPYLSEEEYNTKRQEILGLTTSTTAPAAEEPEAEEPAKLSNAPVQKW